MNSLTIIDHPLIKSKISQIRNIETSSSEFRKLVTEISTLMCFDLFKDLETEIIELQTPICQTSGHKIKEDEIVLIPILRAGLGMVEGILSLVKSASIGHIGLYRDHDTLQPIEYVCKLPSDLENKTVIILDPMLATGGSAVKAIEILKEKNAKSIRLACLVGCPEGVKLIQDSYPKVPIFLAAMDESLNEKGYIVPGLGDAGDRIFGTN